MTPSGIWNRDRVRVKSVIIGLIRRRQIFAWRRIVSSSEAIYLKYFLTCPAGGVAIARAFSSEVDTGSRQENASNQESRAPFRFYRNGKDSGVNPDRRRLLQLLKTKRKPTHDLSSDFRL